MDLNQRNSNPQTPTSGSDSFVIHATNIDEINRKIKQFEANYILHSMNSYKVQGSVKHFLLFHKKESEHCQRGLKNSKEISETN